MHDLEGVILAASLERPLSTHRFRFLLRQQLQLEVSGCMPITFFVSRLKPAGWPQKTAVFCTTGRKTGVAIRNKHEHNRTSYFALKM